MHFGLTTEEELIIYGAVLFLSIMKRLKGIDFMKLAAKLFGVLALVSMSSGCGPSSTKDSSVYRYGTTDPSELPANYESKLACEKQDLLWKNIQNSKYSSLPPWGGFDILKFSFADMSLSMDRVSDELPVGRPKFIRPSVKPPHLCGGYKRLKRPKLLLEQG